MKRSLVLVLFIPLCVALLAAGKGLPEVKDFGEDPGNLRMFVHVPDAPGPSKRPLVVVLHGCTQKAARIAGTMGRAIQQFNTAEGVTKVVAEGMNVYSPTASEMDQFKALAQPAVKKWLAEELGSDAVWIEKLDAAVAEASR